MPVARRRPLARPVHVRLGERRYRLVGDSLNRLADLIVSRVAVIDRLERRLGPGLLKEPRPFLLQAEPLKRLDGLHLAGDRRGLLILAHCGVDHTLDERRLNLKGPAGACPQWQR